MKKRFSYGTCMIWGMLFGTLLGAIMGKIAVGVAIGYFLGTMYYLSTSSSKGNDDKQD